MNNSNKPRSTNTTGIMYLHVDYQKKYKQQYIVRVTISGKHFIVWKGDNFKIGQKVAEKVQRLMRKSKTEFINWYDNDMEEWLIRNGYKNANNKRPRHNL